MTEYERGKLDGIFLVLAWLRERANEPQSEMSNECRQLIKSAEFFINREIDNQ
jgi:hypothetical protein